MLRDTSKRMLMKLIARDVDFLTIGGSHFFSMGPIATDHVRAFSSEAYKLPKVGFDRTLEIYVSAHMFGYKKLKRWLVRPRPDVVRIGIQTEHFIDSKGNELPTLKYAKDVYDFMGTFDGYIDLADYNYPKSKSDTPVIQGPYIFPDSHPERSTSYTEKRPLIFFGALNSRRQKLLDDIAKVREIELLPLLFGGDLISAIRKSSGVINLHFYEGVYSEATRLLVAFLGGNILYSEDLAKPFLPNVHYIPLSQVGDTIANKEIFDNLTNSLSASFKLSTAISTLLRLIDEKSTFV